MSYRQDILGRKDYPDIYFLKLIFIKVTKSKTLHFLRLLKSCSEISLFYL